MDDAARNALKRTAEIALQSYDRLSDADREAVLIAFIEVHDQHEAESAQDVLVHRRKERAAQLTLRAIIEGIGASPTPAPSVVIIERNTPAAPRASWWQRVVNFFRTGGQS